MSDMNRVSAEQMMRDVRTISQWARLAGTVEEMEAARYVEGRLKEAGCAVRIVLHDAYISLPWQARLAIQAPITREIPCITHANGVSTGPGGAEGTLVYAGKGAPADLAGARVAGKIALVDAKNSPDLAAYASRAGAAGVVFVGGEKLQDGNCSPVWGSPGEQTASELPRMLLASVARADGEALRALCQAGPVRVRLWAEVDSKWVKTPIVFGDVAPGHSEADASAYVLFSGHLDSWYVGAMDNAAANAIMLELARLFAARRRELRRGLRLAFWSGHSHGRYASSAWYADHAWFDLADHCVVHLNIDVPGAVGADLLVTTAMTEAAGVARWTMEEAAGKPVRVDRMRRTSDESFWGIGVPSMFGEVSRQPDGTFGWWIHTPEDTHDKVDPGRLVRDAEIYERALNRFLTDAFVPLDYAATAADIRAYLEGLGTRSGGRFDLSPAVGAAAELETLCGRLNQAAASGGGQFARTARVNACLHDLGRILIPPTYHRAGRFAQDPAVPSTYLPGVSGAERLATLAPDSHEANLLLTDLVRGRNALVYALRTACDRVASCLAEVGSPTTRR